MKKLLALAAVGLIGIGVAGIAGCGMFGGSNDTTTATPANNKDAKSSTTYDANGNVIKSSKSESQSNP